MPPTCQINWDLYQDDIEAWYINGHLSVNETLDKIQQKYNVKITPRQFKYKFKGLKNLKLKEWLSIIAEIWRRKSAGKKSDVYFHNRKLEPSRVDEAIQKYGRFVKDGTPESSFERINDGIIRIQTPPPSDNRETQLVGDEEDVEMIIRDEYIVDNSALVVRNTTQWTERLSTTSTEVVPRIPTHQNTETLATYMDFDPLEVLDLGTPDFNHNPPQYLPNFLRGQDFTSAAEVQVFQSPCHHQPKVSPTTPKILGLRPFWSSPATRRVFPALNNYGFMALKSQLSLIRNITFSKVIGFPSISGDYPGLCELETAATLIDQIVSRPFPHRYNVPIPVPKISKGFLPQVFTILAYLASNNVIDSEQTISLMSWISEGAHTSSLIQYFRDSSENLCENQIMATSFLENLGRLHKRYYTTVQRGACLHIRDMQLSPELLNFGRVLSGMRIPLSPGRASSRGFQFDDRLFHVGYTDRDNGLESWPPGLHSVVREVTESNVSSPWNPSLPAASNTSITRSASIITGNEFADFSRPIMGQGLTARDIMGLGYEDLKQLLPSLIPHMISATDWDEIRLVMPENYHLLLGQAGKIYGCSIDLLKAAEKGASFLTKFQADHGLVGDGLLLERVLCLSLVTGNITAVKTLLSQGVDPNTTKLRQTIGVDDRNAGHELAAERETCQELKMTPMIGKMEMKTVGMILEPMHLGVYPERGDRIGEMARMILGPVHLDIFPERGDTIGQYLFHLLIQAGLRLDSESRTRRTDPEIWIYLGRMGYDTRALGIPVLGDFDTGDDVFINDILLGLGASIDGYGSNGLNKLQQAAKSGDFAVLQHLVDNGADVNYPAHPIGGFTALQAAILEGKERIFDFLIEVGADIRAPPAKTDGMTILEAAAHWAVRYPLSYDRGENFSSLFKKLIELGAPCHRAEGEAGRLLHLLALATEYGLVQEMELALQMGASINDRIESRHVIYRYWNFAAELNPLQVAVSAFHCEAILLLVKSGAQLDESRVYAGDRTALQYVASRAGGYVGDYDSGWEKRRSERQTKALKLLLTLGANINAPASKYFGRTALQEAISSEVCSLEIINLLLSKEANVNAPPAERGGVTAVQAAAIHGNVEVAHLLLQHGADINAPAAPEEGRTAIEGAAEHGRLEMVRFLLTNGALPDPQDGFKRAIELATKEEHWAIADILGECQDAFNPFAMTYDF